MKTSTNVQPEKKLVEIDKKTLLKINGGTSWLEFVRYITGRS